MLISIVTFFSLTHGYLEVHFWIFKSKDFLVIFLLFTANLIALGLENILYITEILWNFGHLFYDPAYFQFL